MPSAIQTISGEIQAQPINDNFSYLNERKNDISVNIKDYGAIGDGLTNNASIFVSLMADIENYTYVYIPKGIYYVEITDSDIIDIGFNRDYAFLYIQSKIGVKIGGPGKILFNASNCTKRPWFIIFEGCTRPTVDYFNLEGQLNPQDSVSNSETNIEYGIMFYKCFSSTYTNCYIKKIVVPFSVTGQPISPATIADVTERTIISNNHFEIFEQNSTFGAGSSELIIQNNIFYNMYTGIKISQNPLTSAATIDKSKNIIISKNIFRWSSDFEFATVYSDATKAYSPVGIMLECTTRNIQIHDNIIDLSNAQESTLPPVNISGAIVIFKLSGFDDNYDMKNVTIKNNTLIGDTYRTKYAITSQGHINNLTISNNELNGGLQLTTSDTPDSIYDASIIQNRIFNSSVQASILFVQNGNFGLLEISGNELVGDSSLLVSGDESLMILTTFNANKLVLKNNTLINGKISDYASGALNVIDTDIIGNSCNGISLKTIGLTRASLNSNVVKTDGTAIKLDMDSANKTACVTNICGNSVKGITTDGCTTAVNLNGGNLRLDGNSFFTSSASQFVFDSSVFILSGQYFGNGSPNQTALYGVTYIDYALGSDATYLKTTPTGSSGWEKIVTTP